MFWKQSLFSQDKSNIEYIYISSSPNSIRYIIVVIKITKTIFVYFFVNIEGQPKEKIDLSSSWV